MKDNENRVVATPGSASAYLEYGYCVLVQRGAGEERGYADEDHEAQGCELVHITDEVWARAEMIVKVNEPIAQEYPLMREAQILFTYLHLNERVCRPH